MAIFILTRRSGQGFGKGIGWALNQSFVVARLQFSKNATLPPIGGSDMYNITPAGCQEKSKGKTYRGGRAGPNAGAGLPTPFAPAAGRLFRRPHRTPVLLGRALPAMVPFRSRSPHHPAAVFLHVRRHPRTSACRVVTTTPSTLEESHGPDPRAPGAG